MYRNTGVGDTEQVGNGWRMDKEVRDERQWDILRKAFSGAYLSHSMKHKELVIGAYLHLEEIECV